MPQTSSTGTVGSSFARSEASRSSHTPRYCGRFFAMRFATFVGEIQHTSESHPAVNALVQGSCQRLYSPANEIAQVQKTLVDGICLDGGNHRVQLVTHTPDSHREARSSN